MLWGALAVTGFLAAGLIWWLWSQVPWQRRWILPVSVILVLVVDFVTQQQSSLESLRGGLELAAAGLLWQQAFQHLNDGNFVAGASLGVLMASVAAWWIRWNHSRVVEGYRFDRFDEDLFWDEEEFDDELDAEEEEEWTDYGVSYDAFSPPAPENLSLLERLLWRWLNSEQRWMANLGGIGGGDFLRRQGIALLFVVGAFAVARLLIHFGLGNLAGWLVLPVLVGAAVAMPWGSTTVSRWMESVPVGIGVSAPTYQFLPCSLRGIVGLRCKELALKGIAALPVLCVAACGLRFFDHDNLSALRTLGIWGLLRPGPFLLLAVYAILTVSFTNKIVANAFGRKVRGRGLRSVIDLLQIVLVLLGIGCAVLAWVSSIVSEGSVAEYWRTFGMLAAGTVALTGSIAALIRWRIHSLRYDLVIAG